MNTRSFLDVRAHGCRRVAVCVPRVFLADPSANAEEHARWLGDAWKQGVQYAVCPELGLTGYTCKDLFLSETLRASALDALAKLLKASRDWPGMIVSVGLPLLVDNMLINAGVTFAQGKIAAVSGKTYLPNYGEFEEKRWFKPVTMLRSKEIDLLGQRVPIGNETLVRSEDDPNFVLHVEICEDLWKPIPPSAVAALGGATVFANLSASNAVIGKAGYRRDLVENASGKYVGAYLYAAAGFGEDVSDLGWDGHGMIAERGTMLTETKRFVRAGEMIVADLNLRAIVQDRLREETHADNAHEFRERTLRQVVSYDKRGFADRDDVFRTLLRNVDPLPFVPKDPATRDARCEEAINIISSCVHRVLDQLPPDRRTITGGISGGLDSTLMALFAASALDRAGLPRTMLNFLTLPGFGTTGETYDDACDLIRLLGAEFSEISIKELTLATFRATGHDPEVKDTAYENDQAWTRKHLLFASSAQKGGIVLGTGDLSEGMVGWCTLYADHVSHYHVNAGVPKTLVRSLIEWMRNHVFNGARHDELRAVLTRICERPVSPELLPPGADGKILQKTDDTLGPVDLRDFFTYYMIRFGFSPSFITRLAVHAFAGVYDLPTVIEWQKKFLKRFFWSQFKRSTPLGPKIGSVSLSQRGDWRMPTAASVRIWIEELEKNTLE
jgi:NAD+ synthase (glutamine-hydrolysing)